MIRKLPKKSLAFSAAGPKCIAIEELLPVASPSYVTDNGMPASLEDMFSHQLIHLEEPFRPRPKWQDWFNAFGLNYVDNGEGLRLNDYALVIQAAMSGESIAMGWRHVVSPLIERGLLLAVLPDSWVTEEEFHLIWSERTALSPPAQQVRDWVIDEAKTANRQN